MWASILKFLAALVDLAKDVFIYRAGKAAERGRHAEKEAEVRAKQAEAAASAPDSPDELARRLRNGEPL